MRDVLFSIALLFAACLVTVGVSHLHAGTAWIVAGVLLAGWAWLVLADDPTPEVEADE